MHHIGLTRRAPATAGRTVTMVAALVLAASGCGGGARSDAAGPVGYRDPGRVCAGFAADRVAYNTTTDAGPEDAHQRARRWLHPDFAGQVPPAGRHSQWALWTAHRAVVDVEVELWAGEALPTDTDQLAYRAVLVSATPVGVDGWSGATTWHTVYCALGRAGDGWLITGYQVDGGG